MAKPQQILLSIFDITLPARTAKLVTLIGLAAVLAVVPGAQSHAQTFQVIHNFTGGADGAVPVAGLTIDRAGNLYGTATEGGTGSACPIVDYGCGAAFRLKPSGTGWVFQPLYEFHGGPNDGANPEARMVFAPNGALYGTTYSGGIVNNTCGDSGYGGCGTAFQLTPAPSFCGSVQCAWDETVIYRFPSSPDTGRPTGGPLAVDQAGNLYGTSINGGSSDYGAAYEVSHSGSGWTESLIYNRFYDGGPMNGLNFDPAGNLYGSHNGPGYGGFLYQLTPSGSGWQDHEIPRPRQHKQRRRRSSGDLYRR